MTDDARQEIEQLTHALVEGSITTEQHERLEALVRSDAELCDEYIRYMTLHASLGQMHADDSPAARLPTPDASKDEGISAAKPARRGGPLTRMLRHDLGVGIAVGILFLLTILSVSHFTEFNWLASTATDNRSDPPSAPQEIATLTAWHRPDWVREHAISPRNHRITSGQKIAFKSGMVEITFDTGAKVVIEGPAEFTVGGKDEGGGGREPGRQLPDDPSAFTPATLTNSGYLALGRLVARCDTSKSKGFTVHTATESVVDLGTEFGVDVSKAGVVRVSVFEGRVHVASSSESEQSPHGVELVAGDSVEIDPQHADWTFASVGRQRFANVLRADEVFQHAFDPTATIAYWRFEDSVSDPGADGMTQVDVIRDDAGRRHTLDYWPGGKAGIGPFPSCGDVPPKSMFRAPLDGGKQSFDSSKIDTAKPGVLFFDAARHGPQFSANESFTIEGFFRTAGEQDEAGRMDLVLHARPDVAYSISLNQTAPGNFRFGVHGTTRGTSASYAIEMDEKNFADGQWHYFVVWYDRQSNDSGTRIAAQLVDERGRRFQAETIADAAFELLPTRGNTFIGRNAHLHPTSGTFMGALDEIRYSRGVRHREHLLGNIQSTENSATE